MQLLADLASFDPMQRVTVLLALGGAGLYVAARFGTHALTGRGTSTGERSDAGLAGGIALGHWAPTVAVSMTALLAGRPDLAIAIAFAVSVAALLLALGMTVFLVPSEPLPDSRRVWPFLLPAGLLIVVAGFGSALNLIHALMLAVLGACVLGLWRSLRDERTAMERVLDTAGAGEPPEQAPIAPTPIAPIPPDQLPPDQLPPVQPPADHARPDDAPAAGAPGSVARPVSMPYAPRIAAGRNAWRIIQWALSAGLAVLAGWAVVQGTLRADATSPWLRAGILVAGAISPLLVLPLLAIGTDLAQRNKSGEACSACVGLALLNLLGLVPLLIVTWAFRTVLTDGLPGTAYATARPGLFQPASEWFMRLPSLPLPLSVWRVDAVVITVVGFALLPAALGKWRLGRIEAVALIAGYAGYLAVAAFLTVSR